MHFHTHLFLVLDWCMIKRAENCVNAKINHIFFRNDALVFEFAKSKGLQKGEDHVGPWHLYANPKKPYICPLLALSNFLASNLEVLKGDMSLFEGTSQYDRYIGIFKKAFTVLELELNRLGYELGDLGTHSNRKGVATMIAGGCTVSPPIAPLCICAGWVLAGVKDKYIFRESAGDQYVGRCASCLDQLSKDFAIPPPYVDLSTLKFDEIVTKNKQIWDFLEQRLIHYNDMKSQTVNLVFMCFAALCYHYEYLLDNLHKESTLRISPLFRDVPEEIRELAVVKHPWNKTSDTPVFTGIPPHVLHLAELESLRGEILALRANLKNDIEGLMNDRGFVSATFNTEQIIKAVTTKQEQAFKTLLERTNLSIEAQRENIRNNLYSFDEEVVTTEFDDAVELTETEKSIKNTEENKKNH